MPAHDGGIPVGGQGDIDALSCSPDGARAHEFYSLLSPHSPAPCVHPDGSCTTIVVISSNNGGIPVCRKGDSDALT